MLVRRAVILSVFILFAGVPVVAAQKAKAAPAKPAAAKPAAPKGRVWVSEVSGKEFRVWSDAQGMHAAWVNVPSELAERGAKIQTDFRREGAKWNGTGHSYLPCTVGEGAQEHIGKWCHVRTRMEITSMTDDRISGRGEALEKFDCMTCTVLGTVWRDFVWVPKKDAPPAPQK